MRRDIAHWKQAGRIPYIRKRKFGALDQIAARLHPQPVSSQRADRNLTPPDRVALELEDEHIVPMPSLAQRADARMANRPPIAPCV